jgi:hypothetical protein
MLAPVGRLRFVHNDDERKAIAWQRVKQQTDHDLSSGGGKRHAKAAIK